METGHRGETNENINHERDTHDRSEAGNGSAFA
jgi:hypothetical protein